MNSFTNITVLGSGIMGHGIAQVSAMAGFNVVLRDVEKSFLDKAMDKVRWSLNKLVEKQKISKSDSDIIFNRIKPVVDISDSLVEADLVIEAIPEDANLKRQVYTELEKFAKSETVFASNTSTLPITEIASFTNRPEKFIGIHFFNPPQLMPLVEVIPGERTSSEIVESALKFVSSLRKEPVLCKKDVAGFIVNRIFIPLVHEAAHCIDRFHSTKAEIDSATKYKMALPMGIFELADYTGLDVIHKATYEMYSRDKSVINPHPIVKELFEQKNFGQKTGKGFYEYSGTNYERVVLTEQLAEKFDITYLVSVALNNASWLISNNVCSKDDLEKALRLGMGFKQDLFKTAEKIGFDKCVKTLQMLSSKYGDFYNPNNYLIEMSK